MPRCRSWACVNRALARLATRLANLGTSHAATRARLGVAEDRLAKITEALGWYTDCQEQGGKAKWTWVGDQVVVECEINQGGTVTKFRNGRRV